MHEHSGSGDVIASAGLGAGHRVGGLPRDAETERLRDLSHNPHDSARSSRAAR